MQAHTSAGAVKIDAVTTGAIQNSAVTAAKLSASGGSGGQALVFDSAASGGLSWQTVSGGGSVTDASTSTKGIVKLAGDLGGTADLPTVPGLAGKAALSHTHAIADVTGLQTALDAKATDTAVIHTTGTETIAGAKTFSSTIVGSVNGNAGTASALQTGRTINGVSFDGTANITVADATKEPTVTAGNTGQYYRGDKSWQTLDKTAVGLANVDNTTDLNKPVSTATQTALNLKADASSVGNKIMVYNAYSDAPALAANTVVVSITGS